MYELFLSSTSLIAVVFSLSLTFYKICTSKRDSLSLTMSGAGLTLVFIQIVNIWWDTLLKYI